MDGLSNYEKDSRPWGNFERFTLNEVTTVKILTVKPGEAFSLQTHEYRDEFWRILEGFGTVQIDEMAHSAKPGDSYLCKRESKHRIEAGPEGIVVLEIAFGAFDERDIIRLEDRYGRT
jgi:mannose-6-phosphate isomerase-like protein (cupin superfamily)